MDDDDELNFFRNYAGGGSSITAPRAPRRASPNPFDALDNRDTPAPNRAADEEETPLQQLIRHWMNERHAPDLLPAQQVLLAGLLDHIHRQVGWSTLSSREQRLTGNVIDRYSTDVACGPFIVRGGPLSHYARTD